MNFRQWLNESSRNNVAKSYDRHGFDSSLSFKHVLDFVTKYLKNNPDATVLDFGAGKEPILSKHLKMKGVNTDAHELPQNHTLEHDDVTGKQYDLLLASNVLNVQKSISNLKKTVAEISNLVKKGGTLFATVPDDPNENVFSFSKIRNEIRKKFAKVVCTKIKTGIIIQAIRR